MSSFFFFFILSFFSLSSSVSLFGASAAVVVIDLLFPLSPSPNKTTHWQLSSSQLASTTIETLNLPEIMLIISIYTTTTAAALRSRRNVLCHCKKVCSIVGLFCLPFSLSIWCPVSVAIFIAETATVRQSVQIVHAGKKGTD